MAKATRSTLQLMATAAMSKNPQSPLIREASGQRLLSFDVGDGCHADRNRPSVAYFSAHDFSELRRGAPVEISMGDDGETRRPKGNAFVTFTMLNDDDGVPVPQLVARPLLLHTLVGEALSPPTPVWNARLPVVKSDTVDLSATVDWRGESRWGSGLTRAGGGSPGASLPLHDLSAADFSHISHV